MRKFNIGKPNALNVISTVLTVVGAGIGIATSVVADKKNKAYLEQLVNNKLNTNN